MTVADDDEQLRLATRAAMQGLARLDRAARRVRRCRAAQGHLEACHSVADVVDNAAAAGRALLRGGRATPAELRGWADGARRLRAFLLEATRRPRRLHRPVLVAACGGHAAWHATRRDAPRRGLLVRAAPAAAGRSLVTLENRGARAAAVGAVAVQHGLGSGQNDGAGGAGAAAAPLPRVYDAGGRVLDPQNGARNVLALAIGGGGGGGGAHLTILCRVQERDA